MAVKVVCWDVYSTIISPYCDEVRDDLDDEPLILRKGVKDCLDYFDSRVFQVTCSDCSTDNVHRDLNILGVLGYFDAFFHMIPYVPKDFSCVKNYFNLDFKNLLIIGDNYDIDIKLAKEQGCRILHIPLKKDLRLEEVVNLVK